MSFRFRRSIKLGPGVRLNVGKKSMGVSMGVRGLRYSVSSSGRRTTTAGLPGTGLSHVQSRGGKRATQRRQAQAKPGKPEGAGNADPGRVLPKPGLFAPQAEKRFYEGVQAYLRKDYSKALDAFAGAAAKDNRNVSDDLFAGIVASRLEKTSEAIAYLEPVVASDIDLPDDLMRKYLPSDTAQVFIAIQVTPAVTVTVEPGSLAAALLLAEVYQEVGRGEEAIGVLQQLCEVAGDDIALKLSLSELLLEDGDYEGVVDVASGVSNDSDAALECLRLKARALVEQGFHDAALDTLSKCIRRTAGRDPVLLKAVRYDRADLYQRMGQAARARREWEKLYGEDPAFRDVAQRVK